MQQVDLVLHSARQLARLSGGPQRGPRLGELSLLDNAAVAIQDQRIVEAGESADVRSRFRGRQEIDASGRAVVPGFVDPHTHLIWAGDRADEFELRLGGATYLEIQAAGGGILSTVEHTRAATVEALVESGRRRLRRMLAHGSTTVEVKTGYGLTVDSERKMLEAALRLDDEGPWDLIPTFLGGHAVPPEFESDPDGYCQHVIELMLPQIAEWWEGRTGGRQLPFFDVFCEEGAFDVDQSRRMLRAAAELGFPLKLHADEFAGLGGTAMAVELGATSVDHLVATPAADIEALGRSVTTAVSLPCTPFGLGQSEYTPAEALLQAGAVLALATDFNPGTAPCESMQLAMAIACRQMRLTPAQALAASTINAAAAVGLAEDRGGLEPGKIADLLVLSVPTVNQLGYRFGGNLVERVIKRGQIVA